MCTFKILGYYINVKKNILKMNFVEKFMNSFFKIVLSIKVKSILIKCSSIHIYIYV